MGKLLYLGGGIQFPLNDGTPNAGGKVYTYTAGSSTPCDTWQDSGLTTLHSNPITLDSYGRPPGGQIWFNGNTKVAVTDSAGNTITAMGGDNLNPDASGFGNWSTKNAGVLTKSANYSVAAGDDGKTLINTGGTWTLSLLAAATAANGFTLNLNNLGTGVTMVDGNASETVNGSLTVGLGPYQPCIIVGDGSNSRALIGHGRLVASSKLAPHSNLTITRGTAAQVTVTADWLIAEDTNGNQVLLKSVNVTIDVSTTGQNGRNASENTGSEQSSTWYHIWIALKSDGTVYGHMTSASYPGGTSIFSTLPSGGLYAAYVGAAYNDGSSNLVNLKQYGNIVATVVTASLSAGTSTSVATVSLSSAVPITARKVTGYVTVVGTSGSTSGTNLYSDAVASPALGRAAFGGNIASGATCNFEFSIVMTTAQSMDYQNSANTQTTINCSGWEF